MTTIIKTRKTNYLAVILSLLIVLVGACWQSGIIDRFLPTQRSAIEFEPNTAQVLFPQQGDDPVAALCDLYGQAKASIDVAIYTITQKDIAQALLTAKERGVVVRVITDKSQSESIENQSAILTDFIAHDIPVKYDTHKGLMHQKISLIDGEYIATGSFNYTVGASKDNDENLLVIHNAELVKVYAADFEAMWNDTEKFALAR